MYGAFTPLRLCISRKPIQNSLQDTDEDGLTDYQEVYVTKTDPLVWDSVQSGTSDADADIDSDGLSNIEEINIGTEPRNDDTDYDHLKDGDEITYGTDPLNPDSDGDTMVTKMCSVLIL